MSDPTTTQPAAQSDPFTEFGGSATGATATTQATSAPTSTVQPVAHSDPFAEFGGVKVPAQDTTADPRKTGEIVNDVGNKVIVPKDGEEFADTVKRAIQYHKSLTPEQQQAGLDAESKTIPAKTAQTLGAAAVIGVAGPALLAVPGEIASAGSAAKTYLLKKLAEQTPEMFGHEAVKETLKRYALEGVRKAATGAAWAGGAELLHSIWDDVFGSSKKK